MGASPQTRYAAQLHRGVESGEGQVHGNPGAAAGSSGKMFQMFAKGVELQKVCFLGSQPSGSLAC